jgi:hypothetical protein
MTTEPRPSGEYATYLGKTYKARHFEQTAFLFSSEHVPPTGFTPTNNWLGTSQLQVALHELDRLVRIVTTCKWRDEPFRLNKIVMGDKAYLSYEGRHPLDVARWDGMKRTNVYEVDGEAPLAELYDFQETVTEIPLPGRENA